jgi:hypothetical protein
MKMIVKTDLLMQTLLIVAYGILIVLTGFGKPTQLIGAILMNWQVLSCLVMLLFTGKRRVECIVFLAVALIFQTLINIMFVTAPNLYGTMVSLSKAIPPVLVVSYYMITLVIIFRRPIHKGNFLPNISF